MNQYWCEACRLKIITAKNEDVISVCKQCSDWRNKTMPNIKITAEVDGKQVPLETVSTETFEAIKALEKPKEIPVARLATYNGHSRLILKITQNIINNIKFGNILAIDPISGGVTASWEREWDDSYSGVKNYEDIKPL